VHAGRLDAEEGRLEERLGAAEALVADRDDLAVGQLVRLEESGRWEGKKARCSAHNHARGRAGAPLAR
jgi:hypothetical protein